jgi:hypothetical protein
MAEVAIREGVSRSALLLESEAITIPDNVKRTLDIFEKIEFKPTRLLIVASPFVLRRCEMDWFRFTPWDIETVSIASDSLSYDLTREGWTTTPRGIRVVLNEYAKLIFERRWSYYDVSAASIRISFYGFIFEKATTNMMIITEIAIKATMLAPVRATPKNLLVLVTVRLFLIS